MKKKQSIFALVLLSVIVLIAGFSIRELTERNKTPEEKIADMLEDMTLEEKIGQMLIIAPEHLTGGDAVTVADENLKKALKKMPVGGILFKAWNMETREQVTQLLKDMQRVSEIPLFFACDEEGGIVNRLMKTVGTTYVGSMYEYKDAGTETAYQNAFTIASDMSALGFNLDFAPVADVWSNPDNTVISKRAYSDDFGQAAELIASAVKGFHDGGVATTLKHFPGHGDTKEDSHYAAAYVHKSLEEIKAEELLPFMAGIEAGTDMVMLGHLIVPEISEDPILFSHEVVTELLRGELGFEGVIITDSLDMAGITAHYSREKIILGAINAGVDVLLCPGDVPGVMGIIRRAVEDGRLSEERIDESVTRILRMKQKRFWE